MLKWVILRFMLFYCSYQTWSEFNFGIAYLEEKNGIGIDKFGIGIEVCYKKIKCTN